jgi:integrase/recombinase XerC
MRAEDVDLRGSRARVLGKGQSAWEWLDLPQETVEAVGAWLALRPAGEGPLFLSLGGRRAGGPLTAWGVYWLVRTVSRACGCPATPHGLRHTAITDAIQRGYCLPDVQRFSRHRDLRTLQAYYDGCNATELDIAADVARREARNPSGRDNTRKS